jgi:hypothetical protein
MKPILLSAAGTRVRIAPIRMTPLEAIFKNNLEKRTIVPDEAHMRMFFANKRVILEGVGWFTAPVPRKLRKAGAFYTGTFAAIGPMGKKLGNLLETEAIYEGKKKTMIIETNGAPADTMVCSNHGFHPDGAPYFQLFDAQTDKEITSYRKMLKSEKVALVFTTPTYQVPIPRRSTYLTKYLDWVETFCWIANCAAGGLIERISNPEYKTSLLKLGTRIPGCPPHPSAILTYAKDSEGQAQNPPQLKISEKRGKLIIRGTPEQLAAVKGIIGKIK